jgi:hypothetical protein
LTKPYSGVLERALYSGFGHEGGGFRDTESIRVFYIVWDDVFFDPLNAAKAFAAYSSATSALVLAPTNQPCCHGRVCENNLNYVLGGFSGITTTSRIS